MSLYVRNSTHFPIPQEMTDVLPIALHTVASLNVLAVQLAGGRRAQCRPRNGARQFAIAMRFVAISF